MAPMESFLIPPNPNLIAAMMATNGGGPPPAYAQMPETQQTPTLMNVQAKNPVPPYASISYDEIIRFYGVDLIRTASCLLHTTPTVNYRAASMFQRYCTSVLPGLENKLWRRHHKESSNSSSNPATEHCDRLKGLKQGEMYASRPMGCHTPFSEQWSTALFLRRDQFNEEGSFDAELRREASNVFGPPHPYTFTPWDQAPWIRFPMDIIRYGCPSFPTTRRPRLSISKDAPVLDWINAECHKSEHEPGYQMEKDARYVDSYGIPVFPTITTAPYRVEGSLIALAGACILLAAKLEDPATSRIRSIVNIMERLDRRRKGLFGDISPAPTDVLEQYKAMIIAAERHVLSSLAYETAADPPHKYVLIILTTLMEMDDLSQATCDRTTQFLTSLNLALAYCNDSALSALLTHFEGADGFGDDYAGGGRDELFWDLSPTRVSPQSVACAAIHLAMTDIHRKAPVEAGVTSMFPHDWSVAFDVHPSLLDRCVEELRRVAVSGPRSALVPASQAMELNEPGSATPATPVGTTPQSSSVAQQQPSSAANCACPLGAANFMRLFVCEMEVTERSLEVEFYRRQQRRGGTFCSNVTNAAHQNSFGADEELSRMLGISIPPQAPPPNPANDDILAQRRQKKGKPLPGEKRGRDDGDSDEGSSSLFSSSISSYSSSESTPIQQEAHRDSHQAPKADKSEKRTHEKYRENGGGSRDDRRQRDGRRREENRRDSDRRRGSNHRDDGPRRKDDDKPVRTDRRDHRRSSSHGDESRNNRRDSSRHNGDRRDKEARVDHGGRRHGGRRR